MSWFYICKPSVSKLLHGFKIWALLSCSLKPKISIEQQQDVMDFAENIVTNPVLIKLRREEESLDNIKQECSFLCSTCCPHLCFEDFWLTYIKPLFTWRPSKSKCLVQLQTSKKTWKQLPLKRYMQGGRGTCKLH